MTGLKFGLLKLAIGFVLFVMIAAAFAATLDGAPPPMAYLVTGFCFGFSFKVAGEPLAVIPFLKAGRMGVVFSYLVSAIGMATSVYVLWAMFQYARAGVPA
jgi:hypothetical protein